ncbi:MAG: GAF domain-containing sensor histidine kinase, partial [Planctomycetales bacterium]|nr:GAF domain-containing sensor histidine kinase [Planctomycetales bacterium]
IRDPYGNVTGASKIARDITVRKSTEEALVLLARTSGALASLTDRDSVLRRAALSVVPFFADWCVLVTVNDDGTLRQSVAHHTDPSLQSALEQAVASETLDQPLPAIVGGTLRTGQTQFLEEVSDSNWITASGGDSDANPFHAFRPKSMISVPMEIRGKTFGVITFAVHDVARRYNERDVGFAEDLAKRVAIAIDNAELLESLRTADQQKDEFLAMLAHELRNPLGAISYANKLLGNADQEARPELVDLIDRQVRNLARLIDGLLDVSRISRDKIELRREHFDGVVLLHRVANVIRPLVDEKSHKLVLDIRSETIPLYADVTRVEQILTNILANAIKYTQEGGRIALSAFTRDGHVEIHVTDNGIGISAEMLPRVFDLFSQAEQGLDRSQGGLGIGLTIARRLTEIQGGVLTADSRGL